MSATLQLKVNWKSLKATSDWHAGEPYPKSLIIQKLWACFGQLAIWVWQAIKKFNMTLEVMNLLKSSGPAENHMVILKNTTVKGIA